MVEFARPCALPELSFPLFVPGNRPERFSKAWMAGTDTVIVDLEDAVPEADKVAAREKLHDALSTRPPVPTLLRINDAGTIWHEGDLVAASSLEFAGVVLPKVENIDQLARVVGGLRQDQYVIAIVESALGLANVRAIAGCCARLAFGAIDYCADLGCADMRDALLYARSKIVLAARLAGQLPPLDGVTTATTDEDAVFDDAKYGAALGFAGKLLIHPAQIKPAKSGFAPTQQDIRWARDALSAGGDGGAAQLDGAMIDAPVIKRAQAILKRSEVLA